MNVHQAFASLPHRLLTDEPTSGLDAASASEIMALLRRLASETGVIIITSVHQPSSRVFNSFDQVQCALVSAAAEEGLLGARAMLQQNTNRAPQQKIFKLTPSPRRILALF